MVPYLPQAELRQLLRMWTISPLWNMPTRPPKASTGRTERKSPRCKKGILATSQREEAFDVFLCYKESEEDGSRTKDSVLAQEIYYELTEEGRRVFFARITLEDKAGVEYEPLHLCGAAVRQSDGSVRHHSGAFQCSVGEKRVEPVPGPDEERPFQAADSLLPGHESLTTCRNSCPSWRPTT